jgi:hypothetical protein
VLPALPVIGIGIGFGLVLAPAMNIAANGVARTDAGIASAMVNTMQQVGGSVGTALLSTIAASATTSYLTTHAGAATTANAAVYGYTTAFTVSGSVFIAGAVILFLLLERHGTSPAAPSAASVPDPAHASD